MAEPPRPPAASGEPDRLPRFRLDVGDRPHHAFERWREAVAPVFVADLAADRRPQDFAIGFQATHFGPLVLGETRSIAQTFVRDAATVARSAVDHLMIQLYLDGETAIATDRGADRFRVRAGELWAFDMTRPLATATSDFANVTLAVPRLLLDPLVSDVDALHGARPAPGSALTGLLADHVRALAHRAPDMTMREATAAADATIHLVAACFGATAEARAAAGPGIAAAALGRLRRSIEANLGDPDLGPDWLTRRHGLSRARLYRLFEPFGGVAGYIRDRRLRRCFLDIARGDPRDGRIAEIAYRWGFRDATSFSRAFRARFRIAPSDLRAGGTAAATLFGAEAGEITDTRLLDRWMRDLMRV